MKVNRKGLINTVKGLTGNINEYPELGIFYRIEKNFILGIFLGYRKGSVIEVIKDLASPQLFTCCPVILAVEYKNWLKEALEEIKKEAREKARKQKQAIEIDLTNSVFQQLEDYHRSRNAIPKHLLLGAKEYGIITGIIMNHPPTKYIGRSLRDSMKDYFLGVNIFKVNTESHCEVI